MKTIGQSKRSITFPDYLQMFILMTVIIFTAQFTFGQSVTLTTVGLPDSQIGMTLTTDQYGTVTYSSSGDIPGDEFITVHWLEYMTKFLAVNQQVPFELIAGGSPNLSLYDDVPAPPVNNSFFIPNMVEDWTYDNVSTNVWHSLIEYEEDANTHVIGGIGYTLLDPSPTLGLNYTEYRPAYQFTNVGAAAVDISFIHYEQYFQVANTFYSNHDANLAGGLFDYDGIDKTSDDYITVSSVDPSVLGPNISFVGFDLEYARIQSFVDPGGSLINELRGAGANYNLVDKFDMVLNAVPEVALQPFATSLNPGEAVVYWLFPRPLFFMNSADNHLTDIAYNNNNVDGVGVFNFADANVSINYDNIVFVQNINGDMSTATTTTVVQITGGLIESPLGNDLSSVSSARYWEIFNDTRKSFSQEDITFELDDAIDDIVGVDPDNLTLAYRSNHTEGWTVWQNVVYDNILNTLTAVDYSMDDAQWAIGITQPANVPPADFSTILPVDLDILNTLTPTFVWETADDPGDLVNYTLYLSDDPDVLVNDLPSADEYMVGFDTTFVPADNLIEDFTYYWIVKATDSFGEFTMSNISSFSINSENQSPGAIDLINPKDNSSFTTDSVYFEWSESIDPDGDADVVFYSLFVADDPGMTNIVFELTDLELATDYLSIGDLTFDNHYWCYVSAHDIQGATVYTDTIYFILGDPQTSPLQLISPIDGVEVESLLPLFSWHQIPEMFNVSYNLYLGLFASDMTLYQVGADTAFTIDEDLVENFEYVWYVEATDAAGRNVISDTANFFVNIANEPPCPVSLALPENNAAFEVADTILFYWSLSCDPDPNDEELFTLTVSMDSLFSDIALEVETGTEHFYFSANELDNNRRYYWKVSGADGNGETVISDVNTFIIGDPLSIDDYDEVIPKSYSLNQNYPNPFNPSTVISYSLPEAGNVKVVIFNSLGQIVETLVNGTQPAGVFKHSWDASNMASGIYFVRITAQSANSSEGFSQVRKMLLMK